MSSQTKQFADSLKGQLENKYLLGHSQLIDFLLIAYLSRGHVLIEGPPGTAKTHTAKLLAHYLSKGFKRIQFTTDMLPSDIIGAHIFSPAKKEFEFIQGPIFTDFVVADEINRTPPRTQSALLEAMEERQVTVEGKLFPLSKDFFVVATQNPSDFEGTFPLPEVQLDRFLFKLVVDHADQETETAILRQIMAGALPPDFESLTPIKWNRDAIDKDINAVRIDESLLVYISRLLAATRKHPMLAAGSSVRGGIALARSARVLATLQGREFATPDDIKLLANPILRHRVRLNPEAQLSLISPDDIIKEILQKVEFPK